jgi:RNA polymerase sigma-70 factor (ECF subfamily)
MATLWAHPDASGACDHGLPSRPVHVHSDSVPFLALARAGAHAPAAGADSDESLVQAFASGDAAAFTRLYDRHERATWRFIRHRLGAQHEGAADDVLQETWISVARGAARYVPTARFTTWLFTVARNRAVDHLRGQANAMLSIDAPLPGVAEGDHEDERERWVDRVAADAADGPLARIESREQAQAFLAALAQLPAPQREAFVLQAEGGLSIEEVARATGVGAETAKTRLRYAKARLRTLLAGWRAA